MSGTVQAPQAGRLARRGMRPYTLEERRRLYVLACVAIKRHYRRPLTLQVLARGLATSTRQLQRAFEMFGERTFREELLARRMAGAVELLAQPTVRVAEVAGLVGYSGGSHFARTFRRCYGLSPSAYRRAQQPAC
ncbi:MAG: helix-turn-helix transcriptional regulator [Solirubrobacteraceae bacterium]